jgi:hypothetical protein
VTVIGRVIAATVLALAVVAIVVFVAKDRQTLVPPPEAVVEGFARQLAAGRAERAIPYLAESVSGKISAQKLREYEERVERELGEVGDVRAECNWLTGDRAEATGVWKHGEREERRRFGLRRENGLWRIDRLEGLPVDSGVVG